MILIFCPIADNFNFFVPICSITLILLFYSIICLWDHWQTLTDSDEVEKCPST